MAIADGLEAVMPKLMSALCQAKLDKQVKPADLFQGRNVPAGAFSKTRARYILGHADSRIYANEFPALYRFALVHFQNVPEEDRSKEIKAFLAAAADVERTSRSQDQRRDIAGTRLGQLLRRDDLQQSSSAFERVIGEHFVVRRTRGATFSVSCANITYNEDIRHCEWENAYVANGETLRIHGLGTTSQSNFYFFGFLADSTILHALSLPAQSSGTILPGVALSRDGPYMTLSRAVLVRPPAALGISSFEQCVGRLEQLYARAEATADPIENAAIIDEFVRQLGVTRPEYLSNKCAETDILRSIHR